MIVKDVLMDPERASSRMVIREMVVRLMRAKSILGSQEERLLEKVGPNEIQDIDQ
jgi:hypothetical protein